MDSLQRLKIDDLQRICDEREEESLRLEFKTCNELRPGTPLRQGGTRTKDNVLNELTKDVTALLNAMGGTIIYGIREKKSRADALDRDNAFKQGEVDSEKVVYWLRSHIQPSPSIDVYRAFETPDNPDSRWYIVIEVPQGQQAYMARDHRFYKRVGNVPQLMEQYEVVDVMNRTRGAVLDLQVRIRNDSIAIRENWKRFLLDIAITSTNFIASEYGALKLTTAYPTCLKNDSNERRFRSAHFCPTCMIIEGQDRTPRAESMLIRWGAHTGNVIFPGDWYTFYDNPISVDIPDSSRLPDPTYLIQAELFTINSQSKQRLFAIQESQIDRGFEIFEVDARNYSDVMTFSFR